ncbi:uncharacterized protein LOC132708663 isoform X2 [Cylas formicarius]|nr:uncharacterized protein LOC132708663 isoform X2 [Cylas formicarius]
MILNKKGPKQLLLCACYFGMVISQVQTFPGATAYRNPGEVVSSKNGLQTEPTCEELKAMWRFSKRQSRAAELTNELPMYRDPFADNIWEPFYATSRSIGGMRIGKGPIYGRVVHNPPYMQIRDPILRDEMFKAITNLYHRPPISEPAKQTTFRFGGGPIPVIRYPPQTGSFNHLKELIKTERARELQQQRLAEESAARAASLKESERNQPGRYNGDHYLYDVGDPQEIMYSGDVGDHEEQEEHDSGRKAQGSGGIISFPDLFAPGSRSEGHIARLVSDYSPYTRRHVVGRIRPHGPSLFDTSHFNDAYSGYIL